MAPFTTCVGNIPVLRAPLPAVPVVTGVLGVAMFDFARTDLTDLGYGYHFVKCSHFCVFCP